MSAERLRAAASLLRERAEAARALDWEAVKDLESIGFSSSIVALAVAACLYEAIGEVERADNARRRTGWYGQPRLLVGSEYAAHSVADAILGDAQ